jgi:hypothetical protein
MGTDVLRKKGRTQPTVLQKVETSSRDFASSSIFDTFELYSTDSSVVTASALSAMPVPATTTLTLDRPIVHVH